MRETTDLAVEAKGISKSFGGVLALDNVNLELRKGEVHALLGENGAGKTTLSNILAGLYRADSGTVLVDGVDCVFHSPAQAIDAGIGMVHQHFRLVDRFTVAENVVLGDRTQPLRLRRDHIEDAVAEIAERYGLPLDPGAYVGDLSVGQRQRVEIVKTLYQGAQILLALAAVLLSVAAGAFTAAGLYDTATIFFDFGRGNGGWIGELPSDETFYWDDLTFSSSRTAAVPAAVAQVLVNGESGDASGYSLTAFGDGSQSATSEAQGTAPWGGSVNSGTVFRFTKTTDSYFWAGVAGLAAIGAAGSMGAVASLPS